jgi:hypothetical protein
MVRLRNLMQFIQHQFGEYRISESSQWTARYVTESADEGEPAEQHLRPSDDALPTHDHDPRGRPPEGGFHLSP